ncbi:RNA recognition motif domain-containing protein, partial [Mycobacterium kansasii]
EDLLRIFGRFRKIRDVYLPWDSGRRRPRGFALIKFMYEQDAKNATDCLNGRRIDGRIITIEKARQLGGTPRAKAHQPTC